jgi:hypothetical protein
MRLVILEAPLEQIRESLARANVKGEVVDSRQVGRLDRYFADQAARPSASAVGQYPAQVPMTVEPAVAPPARGGAAAPSVSLEAVEQVAPPRQAQAEPAGPRSESQRAQRAADTTEGGRAEESHGRRDTRAAEPPDFEGARAKAVQRILLLLRIVDPPVAAPTTPTAPAGATP